MNSKLTIRRLATGVPGLDTVVGGGVPEYSFNLIVGPPGSGKTTLAHQIMFALATPERPALFFNVLGEPPLKMLRYQQQFSFFDVSKIDESIRFVSLSEDFATGDFRPVLEHIARELEASAPALVFVDSLQSVMRVTTEWGNGSGALEQFIQQLGMRLSAWHATTFLIGGHLADGDTHPVFTVADGLFSLHQSVHRNSMVRKLQVLKMRGQATLPGLHSFRITQDGLAVFPAPVVVGDTGSIRPPREIAQGSESRLTMGVPHLDEMLGGGLPSGYSLLVAGPSGSGKTILATAFLAEGIRRGEPGVMVAFEQTPSKSWTHTIDDMVCAGQIGLINTRSLDLSTDEVIARLTELVHRMKARRVVIDSLSGFELALAPTFREDFRESLFRMVAVLSGLGVTVLMTSELEDRYTDLRFSPHGTAFLTDAIILQRYIEVESRLKRVMAVIKVRASLHSNEIREFQITDGALVIGNPVQDFEGLLGGSPTRIPASATAAGGARQ